MPKATVDLRSSECAFSSPASDLASALSVIGSDYPTTFVSTKLPATSTLSSAPRQIGVCRSSPHPGTSADTGSSALCRQALLSVSAPISLSLPEFNQQPPSVSSQVSLAFLGASYRELIEGCVNIMKKPETCLRISNHVMNS